MPLIELHSYKPVCDRCGRVGSTWREVMSPDDVELPRGWKSVSQPTNPLYPAQVEVLCPDCIDAHNSPENESRA